MGYYEKLHDLRIERGYTQADIAKILYTTQPQYVRYEKGYRDIPSEHICILAKFYNVSADYILGLTNKERPLKDEK